jgi:hypothetical protein
MTRDPLSTRDAGKEASHRATSYLLLSSLENTRRTATKQPPASSNPTLVRCRTIHQQVDYNARVRNNNLPRNIGTQQIVVASTRLVAQAHPCARSSRVRKWHLRTSPPHSTWIVRATGLVTSRATFFGGAPMGFAHHNFCGCCILNGDHCPAHRDLAPTHHLSAVKRCQGQRSAGSPISSPAPERSP